MLFINKKSTFLSRRIENELGSTFGYNLSMDYIARTDNKKVNTTYVLEGFIRFLMNKLAYYYATLEMKSSSNREKLFNELNRSINAYILNAKSTSVVLNLKDYKDR